MLRLLLGVAIIATIFIFSDERHGRIDPPTMADAAALAGEHGLAPGAPSLGTAAGLLSEHVASRAPDLLFRLRPAVTSGTVAAARP